MTLVRSPREIAVVESLRRSLQAKGIATKKNHGSHVSVRGWPDLEAFRNGRIVYIEVKRDEKAELTRIQKAKCRELVKNHGMTVFVCRGAADVERLATRIEWLLRLFMPWDAEEVSDMKEFLDPAGRDA